MNKGLIALAHGLGSFAQGLSGSWQRAQQLSRQHALQKRQVDLQERRLNEDGTERRYQRGRQIRGEVSARKAAEEKSWQDALDRLQPELAWRVRTGQISYKQAAESMAPRMVWAKHQAEKAAAEKAELDRIRAEASRTSAGASASQAATARKKQRVDAQVKIGNQAGRMQAAARDAKVLPANSVMAPDAQMQSYNMEVDPGASMRLAEAYDVIPVPPEARSEGGSRSGGINIPDRAKLGQLNAGADYVQAIRRMVLKGDEKGGWFDNAGDPERDMQRLAALGTVAKEITAQRLETGTYAGPLTVDDIAREVGLPRAEVQRLYDFAKSRGMGPPE